jgi:archaellum biogenesis ATPase FlaH
MYFLKLTMEVGFPIAAALAGGFFVFLTLKFILASVTSDVKKLSGIIEALDNRVKTMNADVIRIDTLISATLRIRPDVERIGRANGKEDCRKD